MVQCTQRNSLLGQVRDFDVSYSFGCLAEILQLPTLTFPQSQPVEKAGFKQSSRTECACGSSAIDGSATVMKEDNRAGSLSVSVVEVESIIVYRLRRTLTHK
jgi:hypothetical protein